MYVECVLGRGMVQACVGCGRAPCDSWSRATCGWCMWLARDGNVIAGVGGACCSDLRTQYPKPAAPVGKISTPLPAPCASFLQGIQEQRGDPVTASNAVQELLERARELCREQEAKKDELKANYTESSNLARENWTGELLFPVSPGGGCCCSCHHPLRRGVTDLVGTSPLKLAVIEVH